MLNRTHSRTAMASILLLACANACGGHSASLEEPGGTAGGNFSVGGATANGGAATGANASTLTSGQSTGATASTSNAVGGNAPVTSPSAGTSGMDAAAGTSGSIPATGNAFVKQLTSSVVDKVDLLFMVDNSLSMGDKQSVLATAVPQLLHRLTNPACVDPSGLLAAQTPANATDVCPNGFTREFPPIRDLHLGVVTSSLGAFGGDTCPTDGVANAAQNDHAWLLGALPRNAGKLASPFLAWSAADSANYTAQIENKIAEFRNFVSAASELGCGFEMGLEAWYRFLVDPKPPTDVKTVNSAANQRGSIDNNIVQQRQAFLRPDSLVAVVMLSDENDCSMRDNTYSWVTMMASNGFRMWRGSHACDKNPNDPCCYSCMLDSLASDACKLQDTTCRQSDADSRLTSSNDDINVRCRQMKKRFGYDFLFPPSRYVNALTKKRLCPDQDFGDLDCDCTVAKSRGVTCNPGPAVDNPLYLNLNPSVLPTGPQRQGPDAVFLAGIVGVPWQDIAVDASDTATLQFKTASALAWDLFAPKPADDYSTAALGDPLMIESFQPRSGTHPITGEALAPPEAGRGANKINGHEWYTANRDVEYACTFNLDVPYGSTGETAVRVCDLAAQCGADDGSDGYKLCARRFDGCSCTLSPNAASKSSSDPTVSLSPLCQATDGTYGNKQFFAKAYPGLRQLQVLRGFFEATKTDNAIVSSICPKDLNYAHRSDPGYGYNPAINALTDQIKARLVQGLQSGTCLPRSIASQPDGKIPCSVVEAVPPVADRSWCACKSNGRTEVTTELKQVMVAELQRAGMCGAGGLPPCDDFCLCQLQQLIPTSSDGAVAAAANQCLTQPNVETTTAPPGFCYVDPAQGLGVNDVTRGCSGSNQRSIRIVGNVSSSNPQLAAPAPGLVYLACTQATTP